MIEIVYKSIWNDTNLTGLVEFVDWLEVLYKQQRFIQVFDDRKGERKGHFINVDRVLEVYSEL